MTTLNFTFDLQQKLALIKQAIGLLNKLSVSAFKKATISRMFSKMNKVRATLKKYLKDSPKSLQAVKKSGRVASHSNKQEPRKMSNSLPPLPERIKKVKALAIEFQNLGGACYVNLGHAPLAVYKAYKRGNYANEVPTLKDHKVRCGSYGDPAAVPYEAWEAITSGCSMSTGYTHQINHKNFDERILEFCMVSSETVKQTQKYHRAGFKTFRVIPKASELLVNETLCPSETGIKCTDCGMCQPSTHNKNIAIVVHGSRANKHSAKYQKSNIIAVSQ